jgi:predicted MFS family arabinose efflux permease
LVTPWVRLIDRLGQRRVLAPQLTIHALSLAMLILAGQRPAITPLLLVIGACVGASTPPFGPCARSRWTSLVRDDVLLTTALTIESLFDEAAFVVGPVLVATVSVRVSPAAGLFAALVIVTLGGLSFLSQRATEVSPRTRDRAARIRLWDAWSPGLITITGVFFRIGVLFGLVEVGVVALSREHDHPAAAGLMLSLWAGGSLASGVIYGALSWKLPARRRFQVATVGMVLGSVLISAGSRSLPLVTAALVLAGMSNAPALITGNVLVPAVVRPDRVTEANTWLGVAVLAGIAIGSPLGGVIVDHTGAAASLWAGVLPGAVAAAIALASDKQLHPRLRR